MTAFIVSLLGDWWKELSIAVAGIVGLFMARQSGKASARAEVDRAAARAAVQRTRAEDRAHGMTDDEVDDAIKGAKR